MPILLHKKLIIVSVLLLSRVFSISQNKDSIVGDYISRLSAVWITNSEISFSEYLNSSQQNIAALAPFYNSKSPVDPLMMQKVSLQKQINRQEQLIYKKDPGLSFVAGYQKNFNSPIADPEDIVVFRQKFQTGVQWDFLRSGLFENRSKLRHLQFREKALAWQSMNAVTGYILVNNFNMIVYLLNEEKISVLNKRKELMESISGITKQLLSLSQISKENYIKVLQHLNDIAYQLNVYQRYNDLHANLNLSKPQKTVLPVFDIDYTKIAGQVLSASAIKDSSVYYNMLAASSQNYLINDIALNTNVKYNFYDVFNSNITNRSFLSVGVNLSMPLTMNNKYKKQKDILTAQLISETSLAKAGVDTQNVVLNSLYEFKYKQKQYGNLLQKRELFEELIRNEQVKYQFSSIDFNPLTANILLDDYWSTVIELMDLKQDMYRILNELKLKLPSLDITEIVKPYTFEPVLMSQDKNQPRKEFKNLNAVYIWRDAFQNNEVGTIINYCKLNNFNTLIISSNKNNKTKVKQLVSLNTTFNCELLIGSNKLLQNQKQESYFDSVAADFNLSQFSGIHLDVEPHTAPDFKENKEAYFEKYLNLLANAHAFTKKNNLKLSVSIPLNYPDTVLAALFQKCDHVYLMAYENVKPAFIKGKIKEEMALNKEKIVLALRTNDFNDKAAMDELFSLLQVKHTAYHDLDELMKMSRTNLNKKGEK